MKHLLVTGGLGFLGSNFLRWYHRRHRRVKLTNIDCLTYAAGIDNLGNLRSSPEYEEHRVDITNGRRLRSVWPDDPVTVVHFAAETHVDRSLQDAQPFVRTNILGMQNILEMARRNPVRRVIIISTDEVYGATPARGKFREDQPLAPTNPYAASKAGGDLLALAYRQTYNLPINILRSVNVYGPRQYPEKFIPLFITNALNGRELPLYGDGNQQRDWLWVEDFCEAVRRLVNAPQPEHPIYNISAGNQQRNRDVAKTIMRLTDCSPGQLRPVADRPGHDRRYALNDRHFRKEFSWRPKTPWPDGIRKVTAWYRANAAWVKKRQRQSYRSYYRKQYHWRFDE